jgi:hypothetical protein
MLGSAVPGMSPTRAGIGQPVPLHHVTMASDTLYCTWSGSYLRLYTYPCYEVPCLCPFLVCSSLAAAAAVHLVSSYLQSPPSTSIRPFRPFLESQPLRLRAEFLCSGVLCVKNYSQWQGIVRSVAVWGVRFHPFQTAEYLNLFEMFVRSYTKFPNLGSRVVTSLSKHVGSWAFRDYLVPRLLRDPLLFFSFESSK